MQHPAAYNSENEANHTLNHRYLQVATFILPRDVVKDLNLNRISDYSVLCVTAVEQKSREAQCS